MYSTLNYVGHVHMYTFVCVDSICRLRSIAGKICQSTRQPPCINGSAQQLEEVWPIIAAVAACAYNTQSIYVTRTLVCTQCAIYQHTRRSSEPKNETSMPQSSQKTKTQTRTSTNAKKALVLLSSLLKSFVYTTRPKICGSHTRRGKKALFWAFFEPHTKNLFWCFTSCPSPPGEFYRNKRTRRGLLNFVKRNSTFEFKTHLYRHQKALFCFLKRHKEPESP